MVRFISLVSCIVLLSPSLGATEGSYIYLTTTTGKGTVTYQQTNRHAEHRVCSGSDQFTSQFTIKWIQFPKEVSDIEGAYARITYQLKLPDQTYNIADLELRDRRVIRRGDANNISIIKFKVFARNTTDGLFTQEIGTGTVHTKFYYFSLWLQIADSDDHIGHFGFSAPFGNSSPDSGDYLDGSLIGVMGMNCRMTWRDEVVSAITKYGRF